jgi:imidazolonepropionase-like amidohydrolase
MRAAMNKTRKIALTCGVGLAGMVLAAAATTASGQDLGIKPAAQGGPVAIVNATVHPISGAAIENAAILFDAGKITAIGPAASMKLDAKVRVIDAKGKHVYPGLIGAVSQTGLTEIAAVRATRDENEAGNIAPEVRASIAVNPDSTLIPVTRAGGVLINGVFPTGGAISGRASVIRLDGWTSVDMTIADDAGVVVNWPNMRPITAWWMDTPEEEQLKGIRENLHAIDGAFAAAKAYTSAKAAGVAMPADLRWDAMGGVFPVSKGAAGEAQKPVFIQASNLDQINAAVSWATGYGLKPVIVGGRDAVMAADLLKKFDVPVIVMGTHTFPRRDDSAIDEAFSLPAKLQEAGVRWCLASGEETPHERNLAFNAGKAAAFGLSRDAALRGITLSAAEILGIAGTYGSLENGKSATLIITTGDPLEITTRVTGAFIDGREIDLSNKQTKLAEKYRERYKQMKK